MIYITVLGRTDFVHPFFSIISSQSGFIEMDLLQKMFLLVGHEKYVIYSKLVNNPFNHTRVSLMKTQFPIDLTTMKNNIFKVNPIQVLFYLKVT